MKPHRYVVLAQRARGFDTLDEAKAFARANYPSVIMERVADKLMEIMRHDFLWDSERNEWRIMLA